jgi:hypothetical protein
VHDSLDFFDELGRLAALQCGEEYALLCALREF